MVGVWSWGDDVEGDEGWECVADLSWVDFSGVEVFVVVYCEVFCCLVVSELGVAGEFVFETCDVEWCAGFGGPVFVWHVMWCPRFFLSWVSVVSGMP